MSHDHTHDHVHEKGAAVAGTCAHGCCHASPGAELRGDAGVVLRRAQQFVESGMPDEANVMLSAAETLLDQAGGYECDEGIRMFTIAGVIASKSGDTGEAEKWFRKSHELSLTVNGEQHPFTGMALGNLAETIIDAGRVEEGLPLLERALAEVEAAVPTGEFTPQFIATIVAEQSALIARHKQAPAGQDEASAS